MPFREEKARRLIEAVRANLDNWCAACEEIAEAAHPVTGNKARALHLQKSLMQAKSAIEHIMKDAEKD
jgi:hypothetical protein